MEKTQIGLDKERLGLVRECSSCRVFDGQRIILFRRTMIRRCPFCGTLTRPFVVPVKKNGKAKKEKPERIPADQKAERKFQLEVEKMITDRCRDFDCPGTVTGVVKGPVVTEYMLAPDRFTRVKKLKSLNEDLALALSVDAVSVRRVPGKPVLAISVPNVERMEITFDSCLKNIIAHRDDMELPLNFGVTSNGAPYVEDLAEYPHLLIGGATGAGKSVLLQNLLTSLLYIKSSKQLRLMLIDPKTVELFPYKGLPHLMHEPVNTVWGAMEVLETIIQEMKLRTANLYTLKCQNIKELNGRIKAEATALTRAAEATTEEAAKKILTEQAKKKLDECWPYIMVVIDEMANLVLEEKNLFIEKMASISQMARAAGISVIAATQRPSVDVLPGKVKVNFLGRACLKVPSPQDSKTVLNFKGAETLLGKGDLFLLSPDKTGLQRIHVPNCKQEDRDRMLKLSLEYGHVHQAPADSINGAMKGVK